MFFVLIENPIWPPLQIIVCIGHNGKVYKKIHTYLMNLNYMNYDKIVPNLFSSFLFSMEQKFKMATRTGHSLK